MPVGTGLTSQVGWALEAVAGTPEATIDQWADGFLSESLSLQPEWMISQALRASRRTQRRRVMGTYQTSGTVEFELSAGSAAHALRQSIGTEVTAGAGPYTHTFTPTTASELPATTVEVGRTSVDGTAHRFRYGGSKVNSWEIVVEPNEFVKMTLDYVGMNETVGGTVSTPTFTTVEPFTFVDATLTLGGSTECFTSVSVTGENNIDVKNLICATNPREPKIRDAGFHELGGTLEKEIEDLDLYTAFVAGTPASFSLVLNAGASSILSITGQVMYNGETPAVSGPEVLMQTVPFTFMHATSDASAFTAVLTNAVSGSVT
jgi:hypothetical protein